MIDLDNLVISAKKATTGTSWKPSTIRMYNDILGTCTGLDDELADKTYHVSRGPEFIQCERGKTRPIHGNLPRDRVVSHALCDTILENSFSPYLINNNCASRKYKGLSKTREYFERDLHNFYLKYNHNHGYILIIDFSKFYDNIDHEILKEMVHTKIPKEHIWLFDRIVESFEVDVSYMSDEEFQVCYDEMFDSLSYYASVPEKLRTGEKMMKRSAHIGNQVSQNIGVLYPYPIDNYYRIVRGMKWSGRYMDDIYIISECKERLLEVLNGIEQVAHSLKIHINQRKTQIYPIWKSFVYLQFKYWLEPDGRVVKRINPKTITRERSKLKKYRSKMLKGDIPYEDIEQSYKSWMGNFARFMSKKQLKNIRLFYFKLFGADPRWKKKKGQHKQKEVWTRAIDSPLCPNFLSE